MERRSNESIIVEIYGLLVLTIHRLLHGGHSDRVLEHTIQTTTKQSEQYGRYAKPNMVELSNLWNVIDNERILLKLLLIITNGDSVQITIVNNINSEISSTQIFDIDFKNDDYDQKIYELKNSISLL